MLEEVNQAIDSAGPPQWLLQLPVLLIVAGFATFIGGMAMVMSKSSHHNMNPPSFQIFGIAMGIIFAGFVGSVCSHSAITTMIRAARPRLGDLNERFAGRVDFDMHESHTLNLSLNNHYGSTSHGSMHRGGMHHGGVRAHTETHYTLVIQSLAAPLEVPRSALGPSVEERV